MGEIPLDKCSLGKKPGGEPRQRRVRKAGAGEVGEAGGPDGVAVPGTV